MTTKYKGYFGGSINKSDPFPRELLMITPEMLAANGSEHGHQSALFCWANLNLSKYPQLKWLFAIPNGGYRDKITAGKLKATGVKAGVPDICFPYPRRADNNTKLYYGLYIELKIPFKQRANDPLAGCTDEQREYLIFLRYQGYCVHICYGWEQARDVIINYLEGK